MKKTVLGILFIAAALTLTAADTHTLTITFSGLEPARGNLMIALCNSEDNFSRETEPFLHKTAPVTGTSTRVTFSDVPEGSYAVKVIHDENKNGEMDMNLIRLPKEGFGFSNNVMGKMGPPKFNEAKFSVSGDTSISIKVKYM